MKINKYFNAVLSAVFVMGLGLCVASCSDDDKNNSENPGGGDDNKTETELEQEALGWTLITQLTDALAEGVFRPGRHRRIRAEVQDIRQSVSAGEVH